MRKLVLSLLSLCLLSSCLLVDDMKTPFVGDHVITDNRLVGKWKPVYDHPERIKPQESRISYNVTEKDKVYTLQTLSGNKFPSAEGPTNYWLLKLKDEKEREYRFAYSLERKIIYRYDMGDGIFNVYAMRADKAMEYIKAKYPKTDKFAIDTTPQWNGRGLRMSTLDKDSAKILMETVAVPDAWYLMNRFIKVKQ